MELDSFLASPRWEILSLISERPSSPIELAEKTKTTVSFVSQQLKLLEAAQIVKKTKTGAFEKGKPRNLFSISQDFVQSVLEGIAPLMKPEEYGDKVLNQLAHRPLPYFLND